MSSCQYPLVSNDGASTQVSLGGWCDVHSYLPRPLPKNRLGSSNNSGLDFGCTCYNRRTSMSNFRALHWSSVVMFPQAHGEEKLPWIQSSTMPLTWRQFRIKLAKHNMQIKTEWGSHLVGAHPQMPHLGLRDSLTLPMMIMPMVLLKQWCQGCPPDQQHHLGICEKCKFWSLVN